MGAKFTTVTGFWLSTHLLGISPFWYTFSTPVVQGGSLQRRISPERLKNQHRKQRVAARPLSYSNLATLLQSILPRSDRLRLLLQDNSIGAVSSQHTFTTDMHMHKGPLQHFCTIKSAKSLNVHWQAYD